MAAKRNSMTPFFSIIIPVYNVAPYLRECLDSVLAQTFTDWEAICVDDGSNDGSGAILDAYAAKDKRFRVIHQKNAGVSAARNAALELMTGKWFLFLDGDDKFRNYALATFCSYITHDGLIDGILTHPYVARWNGNVVPTEKSHAQVLVKKAGKEDLFLGKYAANGYPFSRVYKSDVFRNLRFPVGVKMAEDVFFWFDALCIDANWMILNTKYYLYRVRSDSVCGTENPRHLLSSLDAYLHAVVLIGDKVTSDKRNRLRYCRRFSWGAKHYLELAAKSPLSLSDAEWKSVRCKYLQLKEECGEWPFKMRERIIVSMAVSKGTRLLLPALMRFIEFCRGIKRLVG